MDGQQFAYLLNLKMDIWVVSSFWFLQIKLLWISHISLWEDKCFILSKYVEVKYVLEVMNRFKGFHLVNSMPEELWTEVCNIVQEAANKTILKKKKSKKAKWLSRDIFTNSWRKKRSKKQRRKEKVHPTKHRFPKNSTERQEGFMDTIRTEMVES